MITSTDAGIPGVYHEDLPDALAVFAQIAELNPEQALKSATSTSANALGISVSTGSLENGKFADLLIVDGDPLQDLSAIKSIFKVYASGRDLMRLS
jgi:Imidazolonepropionase and related amidohydrolases